MKLAEADARLEEEKNRTYISAVQDFLEDRAEVKKCLMEKFDLDETAAEDKMKAYWGK